jgi:hypothetical protein
MVLRVHFQAQGCNDLLMTCLALHDLCQSGKVSAATPATDKAREAVAAAVAAAIKVGNSCHRSDQA